MKTVIRFEANCPGCSKRVRAADDKQLRERIERHIRNCPQEAGKRLVLGGLS